MQEAESGAIAASRELPIGYAHRWAVLGVVVAADILDLVDSTVASIAGPSIREDLGGSKTTLQWIVAGYTLAFAVGLITSARAGDLFGRRRMFIFGMAGFTLFSLACSMAPGAGWLIAFRVLQGLFGAIMIPQGFAMASQSFPPEELTKAFSPMAPIMGLAGALGPILGGFLIHADLFGAGWRTIFLINVPIGVIGTIVAYRSLPAIPPLAGARLDPLGSILITLASAGLIYPLVEGQDLGWPSWIYLMIAGSLVLFAMFAWSERRSKHPLIEPSLFTHRGFLAGIAFLGTFFLGLTSMTFIVNLYLQLGLGFDTQRTGLALVPFALALTIGAIISGAWLAERLGRNVLHLGMVVSMAGVAWFAITVGRVDEPSIWKLVPMLGLTGLGAGLLVAPMFGYIAGDLSESEVGSGSGLLNAMQQFSGAFGTAVLGTLLFRWQPRGWGIATRDVMWVTLGCMAVAFFAAFLLPRQARAETEGH